MNTFILMAEIVQAPQLRYTSDSQTPVAEFIVQFPGLKDGDNPSQIKVIGWGNLAQEIQTTYQLGDRVLMEGRLNMNVVDRPEGFREKQAEMTVQRIHSLNALGSMAMPQGAPVNTITAVSPATVNPSMSAAPVSGTGTSVGNSPTVAPPSSSEPSYDDIPF